MADRGRKGHAKRHGAVPAPAGSTRPLGRTSSGAAAGPDKARPTGPVGPGTLLCAAVLVLAGVLAYSSALGSPFLFDDRASVVDNTTIRSLTPLSGVFSPPRDTPV